MVLTIQRIFNALLRRKFSSFEAVARLGALTKVFEFVARNAPCTLGKRKKRKLLRGPFVSLSRCIFSGKYAAELTSVSRDTQKLANN